MFEDSPCPAVALPHTLGGTKAICTMRKNNVGAAIA